MASLLKNTASQHIGFVLTNVSTGAPVTAGGAGNVVIDGGAQAACAGTFTHKGSGQWDYAPTQAETNGTAISFAFTGTSAIQIGMLFYTDQVDANGLLKVDTEDWKGGAVPAPNVTGEPLVDLNHIAGAALATHASGMVPSDVRDIVGVAVSTTTAQLGVNVVQYNAQTAQTDANNLPKVDVEAENGSTGAAQNVAKANNAIGRGTVGAASTTTSITTSAFAPGGAGIVSGQFIGRIIIFDGNTATAALQGQASNITANTSGATPTFTVTALTTAPASGDTFGVY